jgi:hypothetical protein
MKQELKSLLKNIDSAEHGAGILGTKHLYTFIIIKTDVLLN